jgi:putative Mn2+ efflux pump MntP
LLFGIAANTDNLAVGLAYGLKRRSIGWMPNLLIAVITTAITLVALVFGREIRHLLPEELPNVLGGSLLVALAAWNLYRDRDGAFDESAMADRFAAQGSVGLRESLILAGALSINNIGLAVAGGIGGIGYLPAAVSIFFWSVAMLLVGQAISTRLAQLRAFGRVLRSPLSGNAVLLVAGLAMLVGY